MIKIGTCVKGENLISELPFIIQSGFEAVEIYFDQGLQDIDLVELSEKAKEISEDRIVFSSIGIYVNPLQMKKNVMKLKNVLKVQNFLAQMLSQHLQELLKAFLSLLLLINLKKYLEI